jgi:cytochrome c biogenesis protein CcdA
MEFSMIDVGAALWLGILTSISPCPLSTNIAAISYLGRRVEKARLVLVSGLLYTLGRSIAYLAVGILATRGLQSIPVVSMFLQKYMSLFIGPLLLIVGILLLDLFRISFGGGGIGSGMKKNIDKMGIWGAGALGFFFALAFCPTSAAIFFGGIISLGVNCN